MESTACFGPSPLTRGNPARLVRQEPHAGSIPAHAGQPGPCASSPPVSRVHPRSRGATSMNFQYRGAYIGPSPLTRGNQQRAAVLGAHRGSIPAHAGQPTTRSCPGRSPRVHPRSRGATSFESSADESQSGPSPLTRGNLGHGGERAGQGRSIPTHSGQPTSFFGTRSAMRVHPRSRGATAHLERFAAAYGGPSPLTRGNRKRSGIRNGGHGSIPAHAGQPRHGDARTGTSWVHPRSRGATFGAPLIANKLVGPSPLTRGNRQQVIARVPADGSIPAHAGQPTSCCTSFQNSWVHPRSRGATALEKRTGPGIAGPSPLTRGNHKQRPSGHRRSRSIPAHAGQPEST